MSVPSISFIIPYYKLGIPLLDRAVQSVVRLDKHAEWEIWVIDDGTPTPEANEYVLHLNNPRIHYLAQQNMGLGGARNTGIRMARKEYIQFLDADDYLFFTPTLRMLQILEAYDLEMLTFKYKKVYETNVEDISSFHTHILYKGDGGGFMMRHNLRGGACEYVFKKKILRDVKFTSGIYHEDEEFTTLLILNAQDILVTDLPVYAYFQRKDSIVHQTQRDIVEKRFNDFLGILIRLDHLKRQTQKPIYQKALERRIDLLCMAMVYTLLGDSPDTSFLRQMLGHMRQAGFYPLSNHRYSLPYMLVRTSCFCPTSTILISKLFRFMRFRHAGHAIS